VLTRLVARVSQLFGSKWLERRTGEVYRTWGHGAVIEKTQFRVEISLASRANTGFGLTKMAVR
jgi:hypothetical protein